MHALDFSALVREAYHSTEAVRHLIILSFEAGFIARLASRELLRLGIRVERAHDS